jgi:hypothetical protein
MDNMEERQVEMWNDMKIWKKDKLNGEMISWYNCNIVECGIKHQQPNPLFTKTYTYLPIYLHFYENYRFYSIFASYFPILMSFKFPQSN